MKVWKSQASIRNPKWKYIPPLKTNVGRTLRRVAKEMAAIKEANKKARTSQPTLVEFKKVKTG